MKQKHLTIIIWAVALAVIAGAMLFFESDQLWKVQEKNLFLCSTLFLKEQLVVPGGLLTWIGTWFTQFLYYPWLGVLLLCGWWLLMMTLIKRAFRIPDHWAIVMLIPVAILLLTNMDLGYWIYMLKLRGHFFVTTIGTTAVAALLWGFRCIPGKYFLRTACIIITSALGYPLMGIYGLATALLMGIWSWRLSDSRTEAAINSVVALLSVIAVPLLCYRFIYYQINLANIYWAELPLFFITEEYHTYYIPYYILAIFFIILTATKFTERLNRTAILCQAVIAILLMGSVYTFWMKDENFHRELAMQHRIANCDWTGVLNEAAEQKDEPTRAIVMMRNLALSRLGKQGDYMFFYKNGSKAYAAPFGMRLMLVAGPLIYYQYGMLNYCNRLCIEMGVEFGWSVENLKLLAKCAILRNEETQARRYLNLLKYTTFYSEWAEQAKTLPELKTVKRMMHYVNTLSGDQGNIENFLMSRLVECTDTTDAYFQEQTLLASLWTKDISHFWYHFNDYLRLHPKARLPRYYQEAAYLYCMIEGRKVTDRMPFDESVKQSFNNFAMAAERYDNVDVDVARQALYAFRHTYFYDYYLMRQLPEY